jgi:long-chain fatty acid transport protein
MKLKPTLIRVAILGALSSGLPVAQAGGFALAEQSIAAMGMANAGVAAQVMSDASTIFYNPAGMSSLSGLNVAQGLHVISLNAKLQDAGSASGLGQTAVPTNPGKVGEPTPVPTFFAAIPYSSQIVFGVGVSAPFGLKTEYNEGWIGRYQALISDVKTFNLNPSISYKVNEQFSVGAGFNVMYFQAKLTNNVNYTAVALRGLQSQGVPAATLGQLTPALANREGFAQVKGDDLNFGFNVGAMYNITPDTRVGAGYRSSIKFNLGGDVRFTRPDTTGLPASIAGSVGLIQNVGTPDGTVIVDVETPAMITVSGVTKLTPRLTVAGDVTWTQWSTIPELKIVRTNGAILNRVDYSWSDTMRYAVGVAYDYGSGITARAGLAYDESPVQDNLRTARLPDANRTWLSFGGSYQLNKRFRLDGAFTHILVKSAEINENLTATGAGIVKGTYKGNVNILSLGLVGTF